MKNYLQLILALLLAFFSGHTASAQFQILRTLPDFDQISVSGSVDVYLSQGKGNTYLVEASEEQMEALTVQVNNGKLEIKDQMKITWKGNKKVIKVYVTFKDISTLVSSGSTNVYSEKPLDFNHLAIRSSGASDVKLSVNANSIEVNSSGGSDVVLLGRTNSIDVKASGGSDVRAKDLQAKKADISSSGGSDVYITVSDELNAKASGGSDIIYFGNPILKSIESSGGSDITKKPI